MVLWIKKVCVTFFIVQMPLCLLRGVRLKAW